LSGLRGWRVVVFMLNNFGGMSGGDKFAFEVFGRFRRLQVWWVGTMAARPGWRAVTLRLRPKGLGFLPYLLVSPFWALLSARRLLSGRTIAFSSGDFVNDVLAGFIAKRIFRCRWVAISHMSLISRSRWLSPWARVNRYSQFLSYALMRSADLVLVVDEVTKEDLKRLGVDEGKIFVTRNGVDRVRRAMEGGIKRYDAVFVVSRWHPQKGVQYIPYIWRRLQSEMGAAPSLAIVGRVPGEVVKEFKAMPFGDRVSFLGFLSEDEKFKTISESKVLIMPSTYEAFPIVMLEALSVGTPVLAFDVGAARMDGVRLVRAGDADAFADALRELLTDQKMYAKLAEAARLSDAYSWDSISSEVERLFLGVAAGRSGPVNSATQRAAEATRMGEHGAIQGGSPA
jgi:glycosyltransferase involved in cell wall biosynthesis